MSQSLDSCQRILSKSNGLLPPSHQTVTLKTPFKAENIIVFQSAKLDLTPSTGPGIDNTAVNILDAAGDVLLHVSIRRAENAIVLNSRPANGARGTEERVPLKGLFVNAPNTTITVYDHGDRFQILIDYKTVHYYAKRIQANGTAILYTINPGQISVL
ncbi:galectin [Laccaria bicolor S238N-H82]|uniref:Galectin n=1 Tax=Laccaria bicolor (strain S238N-H82 / ATCC MYA-4686) TaxID=486041 RepID=B0CZ07_LACBS|nr:galectin [Laccaria bicolor S238N-H82]EDR12978.1 galectin [Laccaria bicolor S238N-H82]|eukprot:XP_001877242.1 galectin [Laccaria bicolor S238N-H82]